MAAFSNAVGMINSADQNDPIRSLPAEIVQLIFSYLPICDTWRLRRICRHWRDLLTEADALRAVAARWNTHHPDARASRTAHPQLSAQQDARRIQNFLCGRPVHFASIAITRPPLEFKRRWQLHGEWLAYSTTSDITSPAMIVLHNLVSGQMWRFPTNRTVSLSFELSACMLTWTDIMPEFGQQKCYGQAVENVLNAVSFSDCLVKSTALDFPEEMSRVLGEAIDGSCVAVVRSFGEDFDLVYVQICDLNTEERWSFVLGDLPWELEIVYRIDRRDQIFNVMSAAEAPKRQAGDLLTDNGLGGLDDLLTVRRYDFTGKLHSLRVMDILVSDATEHKQPNVRDFADLTTAPRFYTDGKSTAWEVDHSFNVTNTGNERTHHVRSRWRFAGPGLVWKYMVCHCEHRPQSDHPHCLYISRDQSDGAGRAKVLTSCNLDACIPSTHGSTTMPSTIIAANESFLVVLHGEHFIIFAFDELACCRDGLSGVVWKSTEGLFTGFSPQIQDGRHPRLSMRSWNVM